MDDGDARKAEGMTRALDAVPSWSELARDAVDYLASTGRQFTSEDLTALIGLPRPDAPESNRNNAVGAVISGAARRGVIERVGYRNARRARLHSAQLSVWKGTRT